MTAPKLDFYYFDSCPFCQIVMRVLEKHNIAVQYCDIIEDERHLKKLLEDTGRRTVPCLYIDNKPMHESADIVKWLEANLSLLQKRS